MAESTTTQATVWRTGFLLTQEWSDQPGGCLLSFFGRGPEGPFELRLAARPVLFVPHLCSLPEAVQPLERRALALHDFAGVPVDAIYFRHQQTLRAARAALNQAQVPVFEGDLDPASRYLMERFIHGSCTFAGTAVERDGVAVYHNPQVRSGDYLPALSVMAFDIETGSAGQLYAIGYHFKDGARAVRQVYLAGHGRRRHEPPALWCGAEANVIKRFLDDVRTLDPDILAGWNILGFDLPVLDRVSRDCGQALTIGRRGREARLPAAGSRRLAEIPGRVVVDGLVFLRGMLPPLEDHRLETVARHVLGTGKTLTFEGLDKQVEIDRLYREDPALLATYNLGDAELVTAIFDRLGVVDLLVSRSRIAGLLPEHLGRSIAAFDHFYLPRLHRKGYVAPDRADREPVEPLPGGLVLPALAGVYDHVVALDFKSLYPSVIRSFHVCPYAKLMADHDRLATPEGHYFSASHAILPDYIAELMALRARARAENHAALAQAIKLLMNSFYGILGSPSSRFYDPDLARAITGTGQWILRTTRDHLEAGGRRVLYGDTDSLFVQLSADDARAPHATGARLATEVNTRLRELLAERFGVVSALELTFERYYRRLYLPAARTGHGGAHGGAHGGGHGGGHAESVEGMDDADAAAAPAEGAAKRYAGWVVQPDGRGELQVVGLESVRSDWTPLARRIQVEALTRFFRGEDLTAWLRATVTALRQGACDDELAYRRRLRKAPGTYTHGVPPHVRAVRLLPPEQQRLATSVAYVMTLRGPVPVQLPHADVDYEHYLQKQLRPVVEELLTISGLAFDDVLSGTRQLELF